MSKIGIFKQEMVDVSLAGMNKDNTTTLKITLREMTDEEISELYSLCLNKQVDLSLGVPDIIDTVTLKS